MRPQGFCAAVWIGSAHLFAQDQVSPVRIDTTAVGAFADSLFRREMATRHIPGLVFVLVVDGRLALARGFGAAQLDPWRSVDPARTQFRIASVSKVVTATAAMQLVEEGRLDLHNDVNSYVSGFQLPSKHGTITLQHFTDPHRRLQRAIDRIAAHRDG